LQMPTQKNTYAFLKDGGEMGKLTATSIGH
jgi:hypothetical protein